MAGTIPTYSYVRVEATSQNSKMWFVLATMIGPINGVQTIISPSALGIKQNLIYAGGLQDHLLLGNTISLLLVWDSHATVAGVWSRNLFLKYEFVPPDRISRLSWGLVGTPPPPTLGLFT